MVLDSGNGGKIEVKPLNIRITRTDSPSSPSNLLVSATGITASAGAPPSASATPAPAPTPQQMPTMLTVPPPGPVPDPLFEPLTDQSGFPTQLTSDYEYCLSFLLFFSFHFIFFFLSQQVLFHQIDDPDPSNLGMWLESDPALSK